jgi:hypothetical protein
MQSREHNGGMTRWVSTVPYDATTWAAALPGVTTPDGLWLFDEAAGDFADRIGSNDFAVAAGTVTRGVVTPLGQGIALADDGAELNIASTTYLDSPTDTSISVLLQVWVPPDDDGASCPLLSNYFPGWLIRVTAAGAIQIILDPGPDGVTHTPSGNYRGRWTPIVMVIDRDADELHLTTDLSATTVSIAGLGALTNTEPVTVGNRGSGDTSEPGTLIDCVAAWDGTALTATERATLVNFFARF